jgi:hypothetical protein
MRRKISVKSFISSVQSLDYEVDHERLVKLTCGAMLGRKTPCRNESCCECTQHHVHTINDIIIRFTKKKQEICCVEWPMVQDEPGQVISGKFLRHQIRHRSNQTLSAGMIADLGPEHVSDADPNSDTNLSSILLNDSIGQED